MNTKGGVGKSTIVMALAETLAVWHGKSVLVVDSDSQTSMSTMLMHVSRWEEYERDKKTLVDYLEDKVLGAGDAEWRSYVAPGVSDVDDARSVYLMPSHMELSLFERTVSAEKKEVALQTAVRAFLRDAEKLFDVILIDCPPGLSVLTECWLREATYYLPPTKPDYLAVRGLSILQRFHKQQASQGFAELLGVLVNLKDGRISSEEEWHKRLAADPANKCFQTSVPRRSYIQRAADFDPNKRTYVAKYPGDAGQAIRHFAEEFLTRIEGVAFKGKPVVAAVAKPITPAVAAQVKAPPPIARPMPVAAVPPIAKIAAPPLPKPPVAAAPPIARPAVIVAAAAAAATPVPRMDVLRANPPAPQVAAAKPSAPRPGLPAAAPGPAKATG